MTLKLRPFQREFLAAVENPADDTIALSGPRGLGQDVYSGVVTGAVSHAGRFAVHGGPGGGARGVYPGASAVDLWIHSGMAGTLRRIQIH